MYSDILARMCLLFSEIVDPGHATSIVSVVVRRLVLLSSRLAILRGLYSRKNII